MSLFAGPGSDRTLPVSELAVGPFGSNAAGHAVESSAPDEWMREHHAYLGLMLDLMSDGARRFDVIHNNSLHHLPDRDGAGARGSRGDHAAHAGSPVAGVGGGPRPGREAFVAVSEHTARAWSQVVDATIVLNGVDTDRWRPGPGGAEAVWSGRIVPEKAPHLAIDAARLAGLGLRLAGPVLDPAYFDQEVGPRLAGRGDLRRDTWTRRRSTRSLGPQMSPWSPRPGRSPTDLSPPRQWHVGRRSPRSPEEPCRRSWTCGPAGSPCRAAPRAWRARCSRPQSWTAPRSGTRPAVDCRWPEWWTTTKPCTARRWRSGTPRDRLLRPSRRQRAPAPRAGDRPGQQHPGGRPLLARPPAGWDGGWVRLPRDDEGPFPSDVTAGGALALGAPRRRRPPLANGRPVRLDLPAATSSAGRGRLQRGGRARPPTRGAGGLGGAARPP